MKTIFTLLLFAFPVVLFSQHYDPVTCYGGQAEFMRFFKQEVVYPPAALEAGVHGTVILFFVVNTDGSTRDLRVFQSVSPEIDQEAIRIFNKLLFDPAFQFGQISASEAILEFPFYPKRYQRWVNKRGYDGLRYPYQPVNESDSVFSYESIDIPAWPILPDSCPSFRAYAMENVTYPDAALRLNLEGPVEVVFVVEATGGVSNVKSIQYLGGGATEEVIRLIQSVRWIPGIHHNQAVRCLIHFRMDFTLPSTTRNHQQHSTSNSAIH